MNAAEKRWWKICKQFNNKKQKAKKKKTKKIKIKIRIKKTKIKKTKIKKTKIKKVKIEFVEKPKKYSPIKFDRKMHYYALLDPIDFQIFYVGRTSDYQQRFAVHCKVKCKTPVSRKIRRLKEVGLLPLLLILKTEPYSGVVMSGGGPLHEQTERAYIRALRLWFNLKNCLPVVENKGT